MSEEEKSNDIAVYDELLRLFVKLANRGELSIGITLISAGQVVTGQLIGLKEYIQGLGYILDSASASTTENNPWSTVFNETIDNWPLEEPQFIHLKNAKFLSNTITPSNQGVLWRGDLTAVSGWNFGILETHGI